MVSNKNLLTFTFLCALALLTNCWINGPQRVTQRATQRANLGRAPRVLQPCKSVYQITHGRWSDMGANARWEPYMCKLDYITDNHAHMRECFRGTVGFYGDSTLRQIAGVAMNFTNEHFAELGLKVYGGSSPVDGGGMVKMDWTPSAYFQTPAAVGNLGEEDITVISIGPWDMGTYYKGVRPWFHAMRKLLTVAAQQRKGGAPLYVMHIHRIYNDKCELKASKHKYEICRQCNSLEANQAFRRALENVVACLRGETYDVRLVDTWRLTNSDYGEKWSNGVHVKGASPQMELEMILQNACRGLPLGFPPVGTCEEPEEVENDPCWKAKLGK